MRPPYRRTIVTSAMTTALTGIGLVATACTPPAATPAQWLSHGGSRLIDTLNQLSSYRESLLSTYINTNSTRD